jgi:uncharacterized protein (TIRG00374 family)
LAGFIWLVRGGAVATNAARAWITRRPFDVHVRRRWLAAAAGFAALVWAQDAARIALAAAACGVRVDPSQAAMLAMITIAGGLVPTPGGLGAIEGGLIAGLVAIGVQPLDAAAITAVERGVSYVLATGLGVTALALTGGRTLWIRTRSLWSPTGTLRE